MKDTISSYHVALEALHERKIKRFVDELLELGVEEFNRRNRGYIGWYGGEAEFSKLKKEMWCYMKKHDIQVPDK